MQLTTICSLITTRRYEDFTVRNLFFRKTALFQYMGPEEAMGKGIEGAVMPTDWGPKTEYAGVVAEDSSRW